MAKNVIEGLLVKQIIKKGKQNSEEERKEEIIGVGMSEWDAKQLMEKASEYYTEQPFEYETTHIHNGIAFMRKDKIGVIMFTYEPCEIIAGS